MGEPDHLRRARGWGGGRGAAARADRGRAPGRPGAVPGALSRSRWPEPSPGRPSFPCPAWHGSAQLAQW